ncbi:MAG: chromosomal replication initiator protein DnaA, partial [Candidatus Nephrothrix sp. EaCA]
MTEDDHKTAWSECLEIIRNDVDAESFKTWFQPIVPLRINGDVLTVQVPSHFFYEWLEEHFIPVLKKAIKTVLGPTAKLEYSVIVDSGNKSHSPIAVSIVNKPTPSHANGYSPFAKKQATFLVEARLNPSYTFETFIEGDCNKLARTFGQTVAKRPGVTSINPFMLYGGVGVGKTHLAQAIGNDIVRHSPERKIIYVDANEFSNQFLNAAKDIKIEEFQNYYLQADAIILDDVQHLEGREKTLEIFFNIFNQMHQSQKQIIITSDKPATMLKNIPERLVSRFKWGLTADIQEADFETKLAIIHTKVRNDGVDIPKDVAEYLAMSVDTNLRDMEGVLNSLVLHATLLKRIIDLDLARDVLKNIIKEIQT